MRMAAILWALLLLGTTYLPTPSSGHSSPDPLFTPKLNPPKINYPTIQTYTVGHNVGVKATSAQSSSSSIAFTKPSVVRPSIRPFGNSKPSIEIEELFQSFKRPSLDSSNTNNHFIRPTSVQETDSLERITSLSNGLIEVDGGIEEVKFDRVSAEPSAEALETFKILSGKDETPATETVVGSTTLLKHFFHDDEGNMKATGLVTVEGGTVVEDGVTTVHTSRVFGTNINGEYAQIVQSTSRVFRDDDVQSTAGPETGLSESGESRSYGNRRSSRLFRKNNSAINDFKNRLKNRFKKFKQKINEEENEPERTTTTVKATQSREDRTLRFEGSKNKKTETPSPSSSSFKRSQFSSSRRKLRSKGRSVTTTAHIVEEDDLQAQPSSTREVSVSKPSFASRKRIRPNRFRNRFSSKYGKSKKATTTEATTTTTTATTTTPEPSKRKNPYKPNRKASSTIYEDKVNPPGIKKFNRFSRPNLRKSLLSKILGKNGGKEENYAKAVSDIEENAAEFNENTTEEEYPLEEETVTVEASTKESTEELDEQAYEDDLTEEFEEEDFSYEEEPKSFKREKSQSLYEEEKDFNPIDSNSIYPDDPLQTTLTVSTEYPDDSSYMLQVATIRSPYSFDIDDGKMSTRFITVTRTFTSEIEPTVSLQSTSSQKPVIISPSKTLPIFQTETIPAPENILTSSVPPPVLSSLANLDSSLETLPAVTYHSLATGDPTPPFKTVTETYSTTELMLKTSVLPIIIDGSTKFHSLTQSYFVTRRVEAVKTLPPMEAYEFIPTKAFTDFSNVLDEAGSEKREHLLPGELEFSDQDEFSLEGPREIRVRPPPGFQDDLKLIGSKFDPVESMEKRNNPEISQMKKDEEPHRQNLQSSITPNPFRNPFNPFGLPNLNPTVSATPGLSSFNPLGSFTPDQLRQLALFQYFNNPFGLAGLGAFGQQAQQQQQAAAAPKPVPIIKTETIYETNTLPIIMGNKQIFTTLTRAVGITTLTEYEKSAPLKSSAHLPNINPFQPQGNLGYTVTSSAVIHETTVPSLVTKELKIIFRNTPTVTKLTSSTMVSTLVTSYVTKTVPIGGGATINPLAAFLG